MLVNLSRLFASIEPKNILLAGDMIADGYTFGSVSRISPEAPVGVMRWKGEQRKPGGVGNVALNIVSLGGSVRLLTRLGDDRQGAFIQQELGQQSIDMNHVTIDAHWPTSFKNRIIASNQQMLRIDQEVVADLDNSLEESISTNLDAIFDDIHLLAISDYNKGFLTPSLTQTLIQYARSKSIPVIIDPKGAHWMKYSGATIIKPNEKECYIAANQSPDSSLDAAAEMILTDLEIGHLLVTRGSKGITTYEKGSDPTLYETTPREVIDVTGAGDTVLATLAVCMSSGLSMPESISVANVAAGISVETLGCHQVTFTQIAKELMEEFPSGLVIDADHFELCKHYIQKHNIQMVPVQVDTSFEDLALKVQAIHKDNNADIALLVNPQEFTNNQLKAYNCIKNVVFLIDQKLAT